MTARQRGGAAWQEAPEATGAVRQVTPPNTANEGTAPEAASTVEVTGAAAAHDLSFMALVHHHAAVFGFGGIAVFGHGAFAFVADAFFEPHAGLPRVPTKP